MKGKKYKYGECKHCEGELQPFRRKYRDFEDGENLSPFLNNSDECYISGLVCILCGYEDGEIVVNRAGASKRSRVMNPSGRRFRHIDKERLGKVLGMAKKEENAPDLPDRPEIPDPPRGKPD